jgi:hypothetical protein
MTDDNEQETEWSTDIDMGNLIDQHNEGMIDGLAELFKDEGFSQ